jgi:hypothetical protein
MLYFPARRKNVQLTPVSKISYRGWDIKKQSCAAPFISAIESIRKPSWIDEINWISTGI